MVTIAASVGREGKNLAADVRVIQNLLNEYLKRSHPQTALVADGKCGPRTIEAIELFQSEVVRLLQPDGRVDPGGKTFKKLLAEATGLIQLPETGSGYYIYSPSERQFATAATLASIQKLALSVKQIMDKEIAVGDISFRDGKLMPPHSSHRKGVDVDIRPLRTDGKRKAVDMDSKDYSHELTKKVVEIARRDPNLQSILFNDPKILGVTKWNGHHNHLHLRYRT